jgi:hypothetical protein
MYIYIYIDGRIGLNWIWPDRINWIQLDITESEIWVFSGVDMPIYKYTHVYVD